MKMRKLKAVSAVMAALLILCSVPFIYAEGKNVSKGASVISTVLGGSPEASSGGNSGIDSGISNTYSDIDNGSSADSSGNSNNEDGVLDITLGSEFSEMTDAEEKALEQTEYSLDEYENNEVLVMYTDGNLEVKKYDSQEELAAGLEEIAADESVDAYQPNFSYENEAVTQKLTNDSYSKAQWALKNDGTFKGYRTSLKSVAGVDVNAEKAWKYYEQKRDVVVALIDTGVQSSHPELSGSFWINTDEIPGNGVDDDRNGYVDDVNGWNFYDNINVVYTGSTEAHGTHCAGTITAKKDNAAGISGLADHDNIKIMTLKALGGSEGAGTTLSLALAIRYAEANGASICNLSLGTDTNDTILYKTMKKSKMLFVVAAGNGDSSGRGINIDKTANYPASYDIDNMITVANVRADGTLHSSSDYGSVSVDIGAPGTDIISTSVNNQYAYMTGTSMSAPFVTAAAALVYSASDSITLADTKNIIISTAKQLNALKGRVATSGIVDCGAAVAYAVTGNAYPENEYSNGSDKNSGANGKNDQNASGSVSQPEQSSGSDVKKPLEPERDFDSAPFGNAGNPSSGNGYDKSWYGWNFSIKLPRFIRIIFV